MYRILREENIPAKIKHIVWDVNGTITTGDNPDGEILQKILELADKNVHHSFITGRDRKWIERMLITSFKRIEGFEKAMSKLHFYPELGLMEIDINNGIKVSELIKSHPIRNPSIRNKLAELVYQTKNLLPIEEIERKEKPEEYFIGGDVDGNFYYIPEKPQVELPWFIWEDGKEIMAAYGIIRDISTFPRKDCSEKMDVAVERLKSKLRELGLENSIKLSPVSTAINLVPIVDGVPLDKDVAEGIALYNLAQKLNQSIREVCSQTIAIGDGKADLLFATPVVGTIPIFFVGPKSQFQPTNFQESQITLVGQGALEEGEGVGPEVTKRVLGLIDNKIPPARKVIYLQGQDNLEKFKGKYRLLRGIKKRIRHFIPEEDINIHDAQLDTGLQEGHIHTGGYEAIMLQSGNIDALVWSGEKNETYPLKERGDTIVFLPGCKHTLVVKQKSRVFVSKAHTVAFSRDQRQKVELPRNLESLRQEVLKGQKPIEEILEEI